MTDQHRGDRGIGVLRTLRGAVKAALHLPDRTLHTVRRRRALRRLRSREKVQSVLVICHGNICRSPYAEAALQRSKLLHGSNVRVRSAGFIGPGRPSPDTAQAAARRRGVDLSEHRSRLIEDAELRETDLLVVMDARQRAELSRRAGRRSGEMLILGDLDPVRFRRRAIRDPWGHEATVFDAVYEEIDRCTAELARELKDGCVVPAAEGA